MVDESEAQISILLRRGQAKNIYVGKKPISDQMVQTIGSMKESTIRHSRKVQVFLIYRCSILIQQ